MKPHHSPEEGCSRLPPSLYSSTPPIGATPPAKAHCARLSFSMASDTRCNETGHAIPHLQLTLPILGVRYGYSEFTLIGLDHVVMNVYIQGVCTVTSSNIRSQKTLSTPCSATCGPGSASTFSSVNWSWRFLVWLPPGNESQRNNMESWVHSLLGQD